MASPLEMSPASRPLHPFTSYNKPPAMPEPLTLIGNWQEERALKETTGVSRYEGWVEPGQPADSSASIYATRQDRQAPTATMPRLLLHSNQEVRTAKGCSEETAQPQIAKQQHALVLVQAVENWKSMQHASYTDPKKTLHLNDYSSASKLGPRERMELARLQAEAADLPPEVEATLTGRDVEPTLETTYQAGFQAHDLTGLTLGAKVMKDRDGRPAVRDPTFLAETQLVPKHLADRVFG
ncbi:uncharacterized protein HaLaN_31505, partial [Haematococcus lacustris]